MRFHSCFYSTNYNEYFVDYSLDGSLSTSNSLMFTPSTSAILDSIVRSGWIVLVHHLETVALSRPTWFANHFPVLPVSARTAFIRFIRSICQLN
ncbi:hypothetical protein EVA_09819 [gut metagenome]|uniref:Uncharacterized protein n=1 Tax=gut metagenome TaxID=749906 RepID=J9G4F9_9ZZZZ